MVVFLYFVSYFIDVFIDYFASCILWFPVSLFDGCHVFMRSCFFIYLFMFVVSYAILYFVLCISVFGSFVSSSVLSLCVYFVMSLCMSLFLSLVMSLFLYFSISLCV